MATKVNAEAVADNAHAGGRTRYVLNWVEGCLRKLLYLARRFPYRIAHRSRVAADNLSRYDMVEKGLYDYVPKGTYVYGPRSEYLIIRKNRYRIILLPDQVKRTDCGVGWITEDNAASSYDQLWGDDKILSQFRLEGDGVRTRLIEEIADHVAPLTTEAARVVDVGCGVGDLLVALRRRCPSIATHGCDFSQKAVAGAQERLPDGVFLKHAISLLPYGSQSFEVVLCTDTLEHLEQPRLVVEELVRICVPGGVVVIVVPDGAVDDFIGHLWFWSEKSLGKFLATWRPTVQKLPQTKELLAVIRVATDPNGNSESDG
jgi:2-polyprenyl-3-methyl-5-hydroxy-6-metoxy-1,4-benzoquinol methylase